jgi:hypothetical protein
MARYKQVTEILRDLSDKGHTVVVSAAQSIGRISTTPFARNLSSQEKPCSEPPPSPDAYDIPLQSPKRDLGLERQRRMEELTGLIREAIRSNNFNRAKEYCEEILQYDKNNRAAKRALRFINTRDKKATRLFRYLDVHCYDHNLLKLVGIMIRAGTLYPNHEGLSGGAREVAARELDFRSSMNDAMQYVYRDNEIALLALRKAFEANPKHPGLQKRIRYMEKAICRGKKVYSIKGENEVYWPPDAQCLSWKRRHLSWPNKYGLLGKVLGYVRGILAILACVAVHLALQSV